MWCVVDGNNWFAQDFWGSQRECVKTTMRRLRDVQQLTPDGFSRVAVCWDSGKLLRREISPGYKSHRAEKPAGWSERMAECKAAVAEAGYDSLSAEGYEADDMIASIVEIALNEGQQVLMCSGDRDLHQMLHGGSVTQAVAFQRPAMGKLSAKYVTASTLYRDTRVHPHQWVDYRCIVGDKSDGIGGIEGLGPKAALEVISKCGTLEAFFASPFSCNLTPRQRNMLLAAKDSIPTMRQLLSLYRDAPLPVRWLESVHAGAAL